MCKHFTVAVIAFMVLQVIVAKPKAKQVEEVSALQEYANTATQIVQNVTHTLEGKLPDSKQVVEALNTNAQTLANHVQSVVDKIKSEVTSHQGDIDNVLKQVSEKLTETKNNLEKSLGADGQQKVKEVQEKLDQGLKDAVAQADKLVKALEPEATKLKTELSNAAKDFYNQIVEVGKNLQKQVEETTKQ